MTQAHYVMESLYPSAARRYRLELTVYSAIHLRSEVSNENRTLIVHITLNALC